VPRLLRKGLNSGGQAARENPLRKCWKDQGKKKKSPLFRERTGGAGAARCLDKKQLKKGEEKETNLGSGVRPTPLSRRQDGAKKKETGP